MRPLPNPRGWTIEMDPVKFEPFGEAVPLSGDTGARAHASRWLVRGGAVLFWGLALTIVVARAVCFEPGLFDGFARAIALLHRLSVVA
jgi:hypothetical protein